MQKTAVNGQLSPVASMPQWLAGGSQNELLIMGQAPDKDKEKEAGFYLAFPAGDYKNSLKEANVHNCETTIFSSPQQKGYLELGFGQLMVCANYPVVDPSHGIFTTYATPPMGRVMHPFSIATEDGLVYVNPKQYHGILRRRKMRAKEGLKNKAIRDKPYLHESRHRHACRRPRGAGGRFLNSKNVGDEKAGNKMKKISDQQTFHSSQSSSSEVLQSESGNLNFSKEVSDSKSSNHSGSEVTSMYYSKDFDCFQVNPVPPFSFHPLLNAEGVRQGSNWVTAADSCCDFFKV